MKLSKVFKYFISRPIQMRLLFVVTFVIYGFFISGISYYASNYYQSKNTKSKLIETQKQSFKIKSLSLKAKIEKFTDEIESLKTSNIFKKYLKEQETNDNITDLFSVMMNNTKELSQLRFIDSNGYEKIRFDRSAIDESPIQVKEAYLQNKASRYYFNEIKHSPKDSLWFSKLDLNIEHGKIQMPIVPTLRIGTAIYDKDNFVGIIIMNIFFKDMIDKFVQSPFFYITIYDKDGEFIYHKHPDETGKTVDYSWSRYLKKDFNLAFHKRNLERLLSNENTRDYIFNQSIEEIIPNTDKLSIYYEPKIIKLKEIEKSENNYILTVTIIVLAFSVPLALIISIIPNLLNNELFETKRLLEQEAKTVDEHVYLSITDKKGMILEISQAYEELTGYKKEELIGQKHNLLRHPNTKLEVYEELWNTILAKKVWRGELENLKKDGKTFVAKVLIKPNLDEDGEIITFTSYIQDITYQKEVEKISVTDELTSLYNRREFNKVFKRFVAHSKRYSTPFSMIILDIDYFKQYNDTYGHPKGDEALVQVAHEIKKASHRTTDLGFRLGGEEFALLFSSNNLEDAKKFAEIIRKNIEDLEIEHKNSKSSKYLTVSMGLFFKEYLEEDFKGEFIYTQCDEALYQAKQNGRNQVIVANTTIK